MCTAMRDSFDLKTKWGWKNAIKRKFDKWSRQHIWHDTVEMVIIKLTHRMWNKEISRILNMAYFDKHVINSEQLHELSSYFDPTQRHQVYFNNNKNKTTKDSSAQRLKNLRLDNAEWKDYKRR